jgi:hypothetical protein
MWLQALHIEQYTTIQSQDEGSEEMVNNLLLMQTALEQSTV